MGCAAGVDRPARSGDPLGFGMLREVGASQKKYSISDASHFSERQMEASQASQAVEELDQCFGGAPG